MESQIDSMVDTINQLEAENAALKIKVEKFTPTNNARVPCANAWCPSWKSINVNEFHCSKWDCLVRTAPVA